VHDETSGKAVSGVSVEVQKNISALKNGQPLMRNLRGRITYFHGIEIGALEGLVFESSDVNVPSLRVWHTIPLEFDWFARFASLVEGCPCMPCMMTYQSGENAKQLF
jgi:hypothetical protein